MEAETEAVTAKRIRRKEKQQILYTLLFSHIQVYSFILSVVFGLVWIGNLSTFFSKIQ